MNRRGNFEITIRGNDSVSKLDQLPWNKCLGSKIGAGDNDFFGFS